MEEELLYKLNLLKDNFNPNSIRDLQDLLYVIYLNITKLNWENENINKIIMHIFATVFYDRKKNNSKDLFLEFITSRVINRLT